MLWENDSKVSQSRFSFHFQRIFPHSEEGREGSCILSLKSPAYPAPTEMRMSGKSSEYWSSSPTLALLFSHFHFSHKSIPGGRGRFSFVEVIGGGGKEELCRDLFCFSAPRSQSGKNKIMGAVLPTGLRGSSYQSRICHQPAVCICHQPVVCIFRLCSFYKTWRRKKLIVSVHVVGERWDPITSIT